MKLSLITPIYKGSKFLERYLEKMSVQTDKNFEMVLVVDTNNDDTLRVIQEFKPKFKKRLKLIFNSKRYSRTAAINLGCKYASGKYSMIMSSQNSFNDKFVENALEMIREKKTDIIEFRAKFSSPIKFDGKIRKKFNQSTLIEDNPDINAYTFPLDFNKIFKTETLIQSSKYKLPVHYNSRYSIDATYLTLLVAKTYSTSSKSLVISKSKISNNFNPLKMIRQWEALTKLVQDYISFENLDSYTYAQYYSEVVFMSALIKVSKNKVIEKKFNDKFKKQKIDIFNGIFEHNIFGIKKTKEVEVLKNNVSLPQLHKIHKEIE